MHSVRAISSVGSERLPYKQEVTGSTPVSPTKRLTKKSTFFSMSKSYFYILYSKSQDKYYTGYTSSKLNERLRKHNSNHKGYTGKADDWEVVYYEAYAVKELAYKRERQVKKWKSRLRIKELIMKHNNL